MKFKKIFHSSTLLKFRFYITAVLVTPILLSFNNCSGGFKSTTESLMDQSSLAGGESPIDTNQSTGRQLYNQNCSACHGSIDSSSKRGRVASLIQGAVRDIPQMAHLSFLTPEQVAMIAAALDNSSNIPTTPAGRSIFACNPQLVARTPTLKLTNREYRQLLFSVLDSFSTSLKNDSQLLTLLNQIPSDSLRAGRFTNKEQAFLQTENLVLGQFEAVFRASALIPTATTGLQNYPNTNSCLAASTVTQACHQLFVRELGSRAFRKTLTATEGNILASTIWDSSLSKADLLQVTFATVMQQPDTLYKVYDQGPNSSRGARVLNLTAKELAAKLAFFITGRPPDSTLRSLADSGQLMNATIYEQQVDRLLNLPEAQETVRRLFRESYGYDVYENFNYTSEFLNGQNVTGLATAMTAELDQFFSDSVLVRNNTFNDLMTSRNSVVNNANLAQLYGITASANAVTLPAERSGFLNRAAFLSRRSGNFSSPIKRGLFLLENVLCESVGEPPPNAPTAVPVDPVPGQYLTTRQRYASTTEASGTSCAACHSRINSLGYPFEQFDSIGRARTVERIFTSQTGPSVTTLPINTESYILDLRANASVHVRDAVDLNANLGNNDKAMMCFVRHLKFFESRSPASEADNCQMNSSLTVLQGTNGTQGSVKQAIKSLIMSDDFKLWSY